MVMIKIMMITVKSAYKDLIGTMNKLFLTTRLPYKRKVNWFVAKNWGMKISSS